MTQKQILEECKKRGIDHCFMTIYRIGLKEGFYAGEKGEPNHFKEKEFYKWLDKTGIPEDCMFVSDAVRKYGIAYNVFKQWFSSRKIELKSGGWKRGGIKYARKRDIEEIVDGYNKRLAEKRRKKNG